MYGRGTEIASVDTEASPPTFSVEPIPGGVLRPVGPVVTLPSGFYTPRTTPRHRNR